MRITDLKNIFTNAYSTFITLANGKKVCLLTAAISAGVTTTSLEAGTYAVTTNATGRYQLFVSNGTVWLDAGKGGTAVYDAVLAQAGTAAPTATIHENTLGGTPTLGRTSAGIYTITLTGKFTVSKTLIQVTVDAGATAVIARVAHTSANVVTISTYTEAGVAADLVGNINVSIKVRP
jgi:hypothetical protein